MRLREGCGPSRAHVAELRKQALGEFLMALGAHLLGCPRAAAIGLEQARLTLALAREHAEVYARLDDLRERLIERDGGAPCA